MTTWMLLDRTDDLLPALFRTMDHPDFVELFNSTELARYSESSPLLVRDNSDSTLLEAMRTAPGTWPGLVIETTQPDEDVRDHLRHILIVRFEPIRKGMLRYWTPDVASHFFPVCSEQALTLWLGPIRRLSWHSPRESQWQSLDNPHATAWHAPSSDNRLMLSAEQSHALEQPFHNRQES